MSAKCIKFLYSPSIAPDQELYIEEVKRYQFNVREIGLPSLSALDD